MKILLLILFFTINCFATIHNFNSNEKIDAEKINDNFKHYKLPNPGFGNASIGMIIPFHKDAISPSLNIPEGWAPCDGNSYSVEVNGVLDSDGDGLFTTPNLNSQVYYGGKGRYLRGGTIIGNFNNSTAWSDNTADYVSEGRGTGYYGADHGQFNDVENGSHASYSESRVYPDNYRFQVTAMTVIYIMRIR